MPRRGFEALVFPGKFLVDKIAEIKKQQQENSRRKVTERELAHLHHKIDKLLVRLEEHEPEQAQTQDEECAICISAKATMQTFPCGHRVVCRKCFVKTIQMAVSQRLLPLRCVICRAKILRLKQTSPSGKGDNAPTLAIPIGGNLASGALQSYAASGRLPSWVGDSVQAIQRRHQLVANGAAKKCSTTTQSPELEKAWEHLQRHHHQQKQSQNSSVFCPPRARFRQRVAHARSPLLLPIPETEELELVHCVQEQNFEDFGRDEWRSKKLSDKLEDKSVPLAAKVDHYQVVKWLSKIRRFRAPSILKGLRNKWRK